MKIMNIKNNVEGMESMGGKTIQQAAVFNY